MIAIRQTQPYCPSPLEIQLACEKIQRNWTDKERDRRRVGRSYFDIDIPVIPAWAFESKELPQ